MSAVDLNLLRVFDVLLEEGSVTRAGSRLGLTQSAVSHALTRLRHHFSDPLFIRGPAGMTPTARALEIGPGVHSALAQLSNALTPARFDPAAATRRFIITTGAYGCAILIPPLVAKMAELAPRAELLVVQPGPNVAEQLDSRRADFAVWIEDALPERIVATRLLSESLVWAVRPGHEVLKAPITLESLAAVPQVAISTRKATLGGARTGAAAEATWEGLRPYEAALAAKSLRQRIGVSVPDIYSAMAVAARSDMATLLPRRLAKMSENLGALALIEPPHPTPDLQMSILMLRERRNEPALAWLHDMIVEIASGL
jgi:DNA-binding transcriptional LysR family regulator